MEACIRQSTLCPKGYTSAPMHTRAWPRMLTWTLKAAKMMPSALSDTAGSKRQRHSPTVKCEGRCRHMSGAAASGYPRNEYEAGHGIRQQWQSSHSPYPR
jgi:hypothetical protein